MSTKKTVRKMPRNILDVQNQIQTFPQYKQLSDGLRVGIMAAVTGLSWKKKENDRWCRQVWRAMYDGKQAESGIEVNNRLEEIEQKDEAIRKERAKARRLANKLKNEERNAQHAEDGEKEEETATPAPAKKAKKAETKKKPDVAIIVYHSIPPKACGKLDLKAMQGIVCGPIETLPIPKCTIDGVPVDVAVVNEEGLLMGMKVNEKANAYYPNKEAPLVGPVIFTRMKYL